MSKSTGDIIQEYIANGDYAGAFETIYASAKESDGKPPWAYMQAIPDLVNWAGKSSLSGEGKKAIVVGCGMGDDADYLAQRGFEVTAFDVSETAIKICKKRFPDSTVDFQQADLFNLPDDWQGKFDFVLENRTIQALPSAIYKKSMTAIANLLADGGQLLILCNGRDPEQAKNHIPWGLSSEELKTFHDLGLSERYFDDIKAGSVRRFVILYHKNH